ncbi:putative quinol monooxygenase [Streptomyces aurantiogriseus]|uniref:ABM domain-containing protein n=1 Tax=Streptomyces aurantiogriseus TaxID=66870 RepID=A0A918F7W6_9ACTN|nr:antibiotic biosynthesis monooxygenase [Streptomyces aurantiogriseus]GGR08729.1 hypothetical protein GCM10010251_25460 [Streptomyces aurantiogriseus]
MAIAISATWTAQPGKEDVVREALAKLVPATRAEPGCQAYVVHQEAHGEYPHFTKYAVGQAAPVLADRSHEFTTVLDF